MYKRKIEARSHNHYSRGYDITIKYSKCVSVALAFQHAKRMRRIIVICGLCGSRLRLKCDGTRAETRFRLSVKRTSPFNHLTPNGHFSGRTAPLTYKCCIFYLFNRYTY